MTLTRSWWSLVLAIVVVATAVFLVTMTVGDFVERRREIDALILEQAEKTQRHVDCLASLLRGHHAPACEQVRLDLEREGIPIAPLPQGIR